MTGVAKAPQPQPQAALLPPDGGWGWVIVGAQALSNFIMVPIMQSFGLLYRDRFKEIDMPATDISVIMNVNSAFGMTLGLFSGPLLRRFGYRKVAITGGLLSSSGVILTSWAYSFTHFLITYSIITSVGNQMLTAALSLAFNSYFKELRSRAAGVSISLMGLGPVVMPQLVTLLLRNYSTAGAALIIGGLSLHSVVAALLLQPVRWHMKPAPLPPDPQAERKNEAVEEKKLEVTDKETPLEKDKDVERQPDGTASRRRRTSTVCSVDVDPDIDSHSVYGWETPATSHKAFGSTLSVSQRRMSLQRSVSVAEEEQRPKPPKPWWASASVESVHLGSSVRIFDEKPYQRLPTAEPAAARENHLDGGKDAAATANGIAAGPPPPATCSGRMRRWMQAVVRFFDLDLLRDPTYVVLMVGMSLAILAELNFSLFTPLIMEGYGFDKQQTATFMSIIGITDIIFRFVSPFVGDYLGLGAQTMYLVALLMLITSRTSLILFHDYIPALIVAGALGVAKGFRTVYMTIVIPNYVPIERLASANGLQMVVNSFFILASIPMMGYIQKATGSYSMSIAALNLITSLTVILWTSQLVIRWYKKKKRGTNKEAA
ncbi:uncharacterized protein LOC126354142 isoform X1 [Schistocerca gregaria]|uniref:uncharacterized protein LOC126354142 isoform X1 n=1 Tax=Schistocerca gregaria TaxID=7010 RepID=UPI00211F12EB|nr:uncharacterized protein LOC126354142 isoform X1 [Schistocerca gregaria]